MNQIKHRDMKNLKGKVLVLAAGVLTLLACERVAMPEGVATEEGSALLQVQTRTVGAAEEGTVSYPVNVYVFSGEKCVALQSIADASEALSVPLTEGSYSVYAIGGATAENYNLPTKEEASPSMAIALKEGKEHGDVMVAQGRVTLVDGETNVLTLNMERKVMLLQEVSVNHIPAVATAVTVTFSPLWESLLGAGYAGVAGTETVALTRQADGHSWLWTGMRYLLPPSGETATVSVRVVKPNGTTTYTYQIDEQLSAGDRLNIQSTYTGSLEVTMTGSITGAKWNEEKTISFDFDEGEDGEPEEVDDDVVTGSAPAVGGTYKGCYVFSVKESGGITEVLLLSSNQQVMSNLSGNDTQTTARTKVETALSSCGVEGISGWRLMTKAEAQTLSGRYGDYSKIGIQSDKDHRLLVEEEGVIKPVTMGAGSVTTGQSFAETNILRPVATVKFKQP